MSLLDFDLVILFTEIDFTPPPRPQSPFNFFWVY